MDDEQKELLTWGGGALLAIIIIAWLAAGQAATVQVNNRQVDSLHPRYERLYAVGPGRLPIEEARRLVRDAGQQQAAIRADAEAAILAPLDPKVIQVLRTTGGAFSYNQVVDEVDSRYRSLRAKATRLNVLNLPTLPHEGSERIARGDEAGTLQQRSVQLAEVFLVDRVLHMLIDLGVHGISSIEMLPLQGDHISDPTYVALGLRVTMSIDGANMERLLHDLRGFASRLSLESVAMTVDPRHADRYTLDIGIRQLSAWPESWKAAEILRATADSVPQARGVRSTGRR